MTTESKKLNLDPTGHLAAQFPELEGIFQGLELASYPAPRRDIRIRWKNGVTLEGTMSPQAAQRFAEQALKSPLVASVRLGEEF